MADAIKLPDHLAEQVLAMPEHHYGVHRVTVETNDGRVFHGVEVAWGREIIRVTGHDVAPFGAADVVSVFPDPPPR